MPDKAVVADLKKLRAAFAFAAVAAGSVGLIMTWLADQGQVSDAWHRQLISFTDWSVFGFIATACTLVCIRCVLKGIRYVGKLIEQLEKRQDDKREEDIANAVSAALDAGHIARLSQDFRKGG